VAYPAVAQFGTVLSITSTDTTGTVDYPATVNNNDIAFILLHHGDVGSVVVTEDSGTFTDITGVVTQGNYSSRLYWRRCNGTEGGSGVTVTLGENAANRPRLAVIFTVSGAITSGTPYEGYLSTQGSTTAGGATSTDTITTSVAETLGIAIFNYGDDHSSTIDGDWTNAGSGSTITGADGSFYVDYRQIATASTEAASDRTYSSALETYVTFSLAVKPYSGGTPTPNTIVSSPMRF